MHINCVEKRHHALVLYFEKKLLRSTEKGARYRNRISIKIPGLRAATLIPVVHSKQAHSNANNISRWFPLTTLFTLHGFETHAGTQRPTDQPLESCAHQSFVPIHPEFRRPISGMYMYVFLTSQVFEILFNIWRRSRKYPAMLGLLFFFSRLCAYVFRTCVEICYVSIWWQICCVVELWQLECVSGVYYH